MEAVIIVGGGLFFFALGTMIYIKCGRLEEDQRDKKISKT